MKKGSIRKAVSFLLCLLLSFSAVNLTVFAADTTQPSTDEANAVYLYHLETGTAVVTKKEVEQVRAGSAVKVMSGLLACEVLGNQLHQQVVITSEMINGVTGHRLGIKESDVYTVEQLLYSAVCGSHNDAYQVLAYVICGNVNDFVQRMNNRARELGATQTMFADTYGITDASVTTAEDMAKIALAAMENPLYMRLCGTVSYSMPSTLLSPATTVHNRNAMISSSVTTQYYNEKCNGMSAGVTSQAGNCVVASFNDGNETYLCVVLGGLEDVDSSTNKEYNYGYIIANRLVNWAYKTYTHLELISPETVLCTIPVTVSDQTTEVEVRTNQSFSYYLPAGTEIGKEITYSIRLTYPSLEAPVAEGEHIGYVAILYQGTPLKTLPLYTAGSAERSPFIGSLKAIQSLTQDRAFCAGAIFFAVTLIGWMVTEWAITKRKRRKWEKYFSRKIELPPHIDRKKK